jgi:glycosyltransferase involved in cell wall biosynthesis
VSEHRSSEDHTLTADPTDNRMNEPNHVAVIIPCYNEEPSVAKVVADFRRELPNATIYVFDNNSTDRSVAEATRAGAVVIRSPEQGKGNVMRHSFQVVDADIYVIVDADDTYRAAAAPAMIEQLKRDDLDMLVGVRLGEYQSGAFRRFHLFGNTLISSLISLFFKTHLSDVLSGYRILSRTFVEIVPIRARGFEIETEITLQALSKRLRVAETEVAYGSRGEGSVSKLSTASDGLLILRSILMLFRDYRPLVFFSILGFGFAIGSLLAGLAPVQDYIETRYVLHVPRAILAAGLATLSLLSFTAGLILDTISRFHQETVEMLKPNSRKRH